MEFSEYQYQNLKFSEYTLKLFNIYNFLAGSDDSAYHSELLSFWTLSIVQYSKKLENTTSSAETILKYTRILLC
jgi:hypothetical protein